MTLNDLWLMNHDSWFDFEVIDYLFKAFNIISIDAFVSNELDIPFVLNTKNLLKVNL